MARGIALETGASSAQLNKGGEAAITAYQTRLSRYTSLAQSSASSATTGLQLPVTITTSPPGAKVYLKDTLVGATPHLLSSKPGAEGFKVRVTRKGFETITFMISPDTQLEYKITLKKSSGSGKVDRLIKKF